MKRLYLGSLFILTASVAGFAQTNAPFNTKEYIDVNDIKAAQLVYGDMWWDPVAQEASCEYPKGSGKHAYPFDDYVGFDSLHRTGIAYNGNSIDGTGQINSYGTDIPISAVSLVELPGDNYPNFVPADSFMSPRNSLGAQENPNNASQFYGYMAHTWKDETSLVMSSDDWCRHSSKVCVFWRPPQTVEIGPNVPRGIYLTTEDL